ncbi:MAG: Eco47II family restriction endonuclease [Firmicutes bacterium]|nr:Eco47II family restriction endonuclease [Bacillota bacterium]
MMNEKNNNYVDFISDEHLLKCIEVLYLKYELAKQEFTLSKFYDNMIDPIKLLFDMRFLGQSPSEKILAEINRKIDKSLTNAIGEFHESLLDGIEGLKKFPVGEGYDVKSEDDLLFADIKNKHNTVKGSNQKDLYTELENYVSKDNSVMDRAYWVQMIAPKSFIVNWKIPSQHKDNAKIFKASGDKFYELVTDNPNAFAELCEALPRAIDDFLKQNQITPQATNNTVFQTIAESAEKYDVDITRQLFNENFKHYNGFPLK